MTSRISRRYTIQRIAFIITIFFAYYFAFLFDINYNTIYNHIKEQGNDAKKMTEHVADLK